MWQREVTRQPQYILWLHVLRYSDEVKWEESQTTLKVLVLKCVYSTSLHIEIVCRRTNTRGKYSGDRKSPRALCQSSHTQIVTSKKFVKLVSCTCHVNHDTSHKALDHKFQSYRYRPCFTSNHYIYTVHKHADTQKKDKVTQHKTRPGTIFFPKNKRHTGGIPTHASCILDVILH